MSDALIASLQKRIDDLTHEKAELASEAKSRRIANKALKAELDPLRAEHATLQSSFEALKARADATPGEQADKLKALEAKLRGRETADKFSEVSGGLVDGVTLDDAFRVLGFDPSNPDAAQADPAELAGAWRSAKPGLFKPAGETPAVDPRGSQRPALASELPGGRGAPDTHPRRVTYSAAEVGETGWQARRPELVQAIKAGTATLVEPK